MDSSRASHDPETDACVSCQERIQEFVAAPDDTQGPLHKGHRLERRPISTGSP